MSDSLRPHEPANPNPVPNVPNPHTRPSEIFRNAVSELRKRRGWTQAQLADHVGVDRTTVSKLESGERGVSLDEAFAYAGALGAHPSRLMAPVDNTRVQVRRGELVEGHVFRAWLRGTSWVRPDGVEYIPAEVDEDRLWERCNTSLTLVFHAHRKLLEAVTDAVDPASEAAASIAECLQHANQSLDDFAAAYAERRNPRPVVARRVRRKAA